MYTNNILPNNFSLISLSSSISEDNPVLSSSAVLEAALYIRNNYHGDTYFPVMAQCFTEVSASELTLGVPNGIDSIEDWRHPSVIEFSLMKYFIATYAKRHKWQFITTVTHPEEECVSFLFWNCLSSL